MHVKHRSCIFAILLVILLVNSRASGQNLLGRATRGILGVKAGLISRMDYSSDWTLHSDVGSCAQVFADFPQGRNFYLTTAFDFYYIGISNSNQIMIDASVGIKRLFPLPRAGMFIKPALSVGFAYLSHMQNIPAARFLSIKLYVETHFTIDNRKAWVGELGIFRAPVGDNGHTTVTFGPGVYFRWGVAFR